MRILGLDIQAHSIAAVEVETAFGRFEVRDTHEMKLEAGHDPIGAASQLIASLSRAPDRIVQAVPGELSTFRNLQIASKDKKAVRAALEFELEDDLPFESDLLHYDSVILQSGSAGSQIHVGAVKKDNFEPYLQQLKAFGIDPDVVTTEPWAFRSLLSRIYGANAATREVAPPVMIVGLESKKTFFYIHSGAQPVMYREIPFGLDSLVAAILQKNPNASAAEAQNWIFDIGLGGVDETISNLIAELLDHLIPELKQSELAARSVLHTGVEQVWLTGDGALIPGLAEWLTQNSDRTVSLFRPLSMISPGSVSYSDTSEVRFAKAIALAMSLVPADKLPCLNLRRGEFAKTGAQGFSTFDLIKKPLPYVMTLLAILLVTKTIEVKYYQSKLDETDDTVKRAVKTYFGGISDSAVRNHMADVSKLKRNIEGDLAKERELSKLLTPNAKSPFEFLKVLSQKISKDVVLDMIDYDVGTDFTESFKDNRAIKANLTFIVASATGLARLTEVLEKSLGFKKGNSEEIMQEGRKAFKVTFSGNP